MQRRLFIYCHNIAKFLTFPNEKQKKPHLSVRLFIRCPWLLLADLGAVVVHCIGSLIVIEIPVKEVLNPYEQVP